MLGRKKARWIKLGVIIGIAAVTTLSYALWVRDRDATCQRLNENAPFMDARVIKDTVGRCSICRDDGWLYDIAFETCPKPQTL